MTEKKNIFTNPCSERWEDMTGDDRKRMCALCKENIHDVSHLDLATVATEYIDSGKCVSMNSDQIQFFQFLRSIPKIAGLSAALSLYPFASIQAQDDNSKDSICTIYGKVQGNSNSNRGIHIVINRETYATQSDDQGSFKISVPKGYKVESSNVKQLVDKKLNKEFIRIKKVRLPAPKFRTIGTPSF